MPQLPNADGIVEAGIGTCQSCNHTLQDNQHGLDQDDFGMVGDVYEYLGRCKYCKFCREELR